MTAGAGQVESGILPLPTGLKRIALALESRALQVAGFGQRLARP